jgi:hypothetical protein
MIYKMNHIVLFMPNKQQKYNKFLFYYLYIHFKTLGEYEKAIHKQCEPTKTASSNVEYLGGVVSYDNPFFYFIYLRFLLYL